MQQLKKGKTRIKALCLLVLFAVYQAGYTAFLHVHYVDGVPVVHSHPFHQTHGHTLLLPGYRPCRASDFPDRRRSGLPVAALGVADRVVLCPAGAACCPQTVGTPYAQSPSHIFLHPLNMLSVPGSGTVVRRCSCTRTERVCPVGMFFHPAWAMRLPA